MLDFVGWNKRVLPNVKLGGPDERSQRLVAALDRQVGTGCEGGSRPAEPRRAPSVFRCRSARGTYLGQKAKMTAVRFIDDEWYEVRSEMESRMWEFVDGMKAGSFCVKPSAPKDTCPRCDYSSVCRYETFRIRGKE